APNTDTRDAIILQHLQRMEVTLEKTRQSVAGLRALLERRDAALVIEHRQLPRMRAAAITERVRWDEAEQWLAESFARLIDAIGAAQRLGPDSALYTPAFFHAHVGEVTAFAPVAEAHGLSSFLPHIEVIDL